MRDKRLLTVTTAALSNNLVDLPTVKTELSIKPSDLSNDVWLNRAIAQISKAARSYCGRTFQIEAATETIYLDRLWRSHQVDRGGETLRLSRWPLISVSSVIVDAGLDSQATLVQGTDYIVKADTGDLLHLDSSSGLLSRWMSSTVTVSYSAGYGAQVTEKTAVPASSPYTYLTANAADFALDAGVAYANGTALTAVAGAPAQGQYAINRATGQYTFAAADAGQSVDVTYAFDEIPEDLQEIVLRLVTARFQARGRDPNLMERNQPEIGSARYWIPNNDGAFAPEIRDALDRYRVPVTA